MRSWFILAWKEFWLPFYYRKPGCPGGRDFVWLTTFMALLLTLILLLFASREGLLNRFVDILLGNVPGYGVPISVTNNMLSKGGINAIDKSVLAEVRKLGEGSNPDQEPKIKGLTIYPYRALEASLRPFIELPDESIWQNRQPNGSKLGPDFDGWAVYQDNPLWTLNPSDQTFPLEIIISRSLFFKYFDYDKYRHVLQHSLPEKYFRTLPEKLDESRDISLKSLWLKVTLGFRRELLPFKVTWVERFPVIDKIVYVFPLTTYHALTAAFDFPDLQHFPEFYGTDGSRIKQILLERKQDDTENKTEIYDEFASKLGGETRNYRGDILITFPYPVRKFWIDAYAEQYDLLSYTVTESIKGDTIGHDDESLILPCHRLPIEVLKDAQIASCSDEQPQSVHIDVTARGNGFHHALVYVPDRTLLSRAVEELEKVRDNALSIHPFYQDALNRFGFLSKMLTALGKPYTLFLTIFLVLLLGIQIGVLIGHHRHRYGVFLAKGMEWWQIYFTVWLQIFMAQALGTIIAIIVITRARSFLQSAIQFVADEYKETLSLADLNLLPLTYTDYFLASGIVLLLAWLLATIFLYRMPLRPRTHPAILLH